MVTSHAACCLRCLDLWHGAVPVATAEHCERQWPQTAGCTNLFYKTKLLSVCSGPGLPQAGPAYQVHGCRKGERCRPKLRCYSPDQRLSDHPLTEATACLQSTHHPKLESFSQCDCIACHRDHSLSEPTHEAQCQVGSQCSLTKLCLPELTRRGAGQSRCPPCARPGSGVSGWTRPQWQRWRARCSGSSRPP